MLSKISIAIGVAAAVQIQREPLLTWKAKDPASHPVNYFVPNFGMDHDISHA